MSFLTPTAPLLDLCIDLSPILQLRDLREDSGSLDLAKAVRIVEVAGADGIRLNLSGSSLDRMHADLAALQSAAAIPLQITTVPDAATIDLLSTIRPQAIYFSMPYLVGLQLAGLDDLRQPIATIRDAILRLAGVPVALTLSSDTDPAQFWLMVDAGISTIELSTNRFATTHGEQRDEELSRLTALAVEAVRFGLRVQIAHGLTLQNLTQAAVLPQLTQVTVGHAVAMRALTVGLHHAVSEFKALLIAPTAGTTL